MRRCLLLIATACSSGPAPATTPAPRDVATTPRPAASDAGVPTRDDAERAPAAVAGAAAAAPQLLRPIARATRNVVFVQGRDRLALSLREQAWITAGDDGFIADAATGDAVAGLLRRAGDGTRLWGRTPAVASGDAKRPTLARTTSSKPIAAPGVIEAVVELGGDGHEVWQYTTGTSTRLAVVDGRDRIKRLPALATIGKPVPGIQPGLCGAPSVWRIAPAPTGVAAIHMECHIATPLRMQTITRGGGTSVRTLGAMDRANLEPNQFGVLADGTPVLAGRRDGKLAIARAADDGTWSVQTADIPTVDVAGLAISDGAIWTIALGEGPDGKDLWTLARDGVAVELRDPAGTVLSPRDVGYDARLGVVVSAIDVAAVERDVFGPIPTYVFAERAGADVPIRDLP
jgi:hypothetical protein